MADKFFEQVEEELARKSPQAVSAKAEASHVEVPPTAQPTTLPESPGTGMISLAAFPDGADVTVDGDFVGSAPANLKLSVGKHLIAVTEQGYKPWSRELSVLGGSDVKLKATLDKE